MSDSRSKRAASPWGALTAEMVLYNINMGTTFAEFWSGVADCNLSAFLAVIPTRETPNDRRRKFSIIQGGKL
jgi:hypothetical protein